MKEQLEALIERLAYKKSHTFNRADYASYKGVASCPARIEWWLEQLPRKVMIDRVDINAYSDEIIVHEYHPILKCHIEKKMLELGIMDDPKWEDEDMKYWNDLWVELGFTPSLQEIYAECEWEQAKVFGYPLAVGTPEESGPYLVPKQPTHRAFFEFLLSTFKPETL